MPWTHAGDHHKKVERLDKKELNRSDPNSLIIRMMKLDAMSFGGGGCHVQAGVENLCNVIVGNPEVSRPLGVQ